MSMSASPWLVFVGTDVVSTQQAASHVTASLVTLLPMTKPAVEVEWPP